MAKTRPRNDEVSPEGLLPAARELALAAHAGQTRPQTGGPFADHLLAVAKLVEALEASDTVIAAAYLPDAVEKTDLTEAEVAAACGAEVEALVLALTEDSAIADYRGRKRDLRRQVVQAGWPVTLLYAADRVANLRDWASIDPAARDGVGRALGTTFTERLELWREDLAELTAADSELPLLAEIEIEIGKLTKSAAA